MKAVYIIHGWGGNPNEPMLLWLKKELEQEGYEVVVPTMPNTDEPEIKTWTEKIKEVANPNKETIFVGHSIGCQAVLRYIETLPNDIQIGRIVLIAPWMHLDENTIAEEGEEVAEIAKPWMETPIDFDKIKNYTKDITAIFSDNDPYVPLSEKEIFQKKLGAKIIVESKMGHFAPDDGIDNLPSALEEIKRIL